MIEGFEEYTVELKPSEHKLAAYIAERLKNNVGAEMAVTNKTIRAACAQMGHKVSDAKLRKFVQYIRQHNLCPNLCATSNGYFVAKNEEELKSYINSLQQRVNSIEFTLACFKKYRG